MPLSALNSGATRIFPFQLRPVHSLSISPEEQLDNCRGSERSWVISRSHCLRVRSEKLFSFHQALIAENPVHNRSSHCLPLNRIRDFLCITRIRKKSAFDQNSRHIDLAQNLKSSPSNPAILKRAICGQRFVDLVGKQRVEAILPMPCRTWRRRTPVC